MMNTPCFINWRAEHVELKAILMYHSAIGIHSDYSQSATKCSLPFQITKISIMFTGKALNCLKEIEVLGKMSIYDSVSPKRPSRQKCRLSRHEAQRWTQHHVLRSRRARYSRHTSNNDRTTLFPREWLASSRSQLLPCSPQCVCEYAKVPSWNPTCLNNRCIGCARVR